MSKRDQHEDFSAAMTNLISRRRYLAHGLSAATPVRVPGLGTMAVDRYWRIYYDPCVFRIWSIEQAATVIEHEFWHPARNHHARCEAIGADPKTWNDCTDAEINDDLTGLPPGCVMPKSLGCEPGDIAEVYYEQVARQRQAKPREPGDPGSQGSPDEGGEQRPGDDGKPNPCQGGSGSDGVKRPYELGEPSAKQPGLEEHEADLVRRQIANEIRRWIATNGIGSVPGSQARWADGLLTPPKVPWYRELACTLRGDLARAGVADYTYSRPARRDGIWADVVMPAMRAHRPRVAVQIDTSGSMGNAEILAALGETQGVCRAAGAEITVYACDAAVQDAQRVTSARSLRLVGGGGTDMGAGFPAMAKARPRFDIVVVLTDGHTGWPTAHPMPWAKVLVVLVGTGPAAPSWAKTIRAVP